jgi:uncharacterized protein YraI
MKSILNPLAIAAISIAMLMPAAAADEICAVADPTGTPLNVRSSPNGTILGALHNDTIVMIKETATVGGQKWARVLPNGGKQGWVYRDYLDCDL